ncbi:solute carrier family 43 member 3-like [Pecten maximus]|uniref:solute carrier family 43 member 3-like n=1 Tax=Pecten maximus TaxID=6579 RepID=UPI001458C534|nr:solute carrier family 43 member 3-like [Pecten maximus]
MGSLIGAYHSSAIILLAMKETHSSHMETQTSFMFLTIGVVPILVSTIAFLPKSRIPWPLPAGYGKQGEAWKDSSGSRRTTNGQGPSKSSCSFATFRIIACSSVYIWSVIWFAIYNLRSFTYDGNVRLMLIRYGVAKENVYTYTELYALLQLTALPFGPCIGAILDWRRKSTASYDPPIQQMQNILFALVLTFLFALANNILPTIPSLFFQVLGFVLQTVERVAVVTCLCAFVSHVNFPIEHFGKLIGLHFAVASAVSFLRFPFQSFITSSLHGDPFYINLLLLVLLLVSCGHPINVWYHCRLGLIRDTSNSERDRTSANEQLVSEDLVIAAEGTP